MYCREAEEYIGQSECENCDSSCENYSDHKQTPDQRQKEIERLRGSELATKIKATLAKHLNVDEATLDKLTINLFDGAFKSAESQLERCLREMANKKAVEFIEKKATGMLETLFDKMVEENILVLGKDEKAQETKIREIILNRTKKFFDDQNNYNSRNSRSDTVDQAIERMVDSKVSTCLNEIKEEAIEKFNKDIMKKMMLGMVGQIQDDKRLLAVLNIE